MNDITNSTNSLNSIKKIVKKVKQSSPEKKTVFSSLQSWANKIEKPSNACF